MRRQEVGGAAGEDRRGNGRGAEACDEATEEGVARLGGVVEDEACATVGSGGVVGLGGDEDGVGNAADGEW